ncbi:MAG: Cytochrome c family [Rhodospirillaceae bacterium]|nr:MAG: Cytochrome c family [Rhodospirillaceae bacterium]TNC96209.1 MAG: Cytochrome c family protein [Stygiobacter sp.]
MNTSSLSLLAALVLLPAPAFAHQAAIPFFGGQIAASGDMHVEFAIRDGGVRVWLRDHAEKPVAATGKVTLLLGGAKSEITLRAEGDRLVGEAPVKTADKVVAVLALNAGGKAVSARFAQEALVQPGLNAAASVGQGLFAANCASCHGPSLRGTDQGPPLLHAWYAAGSGHDDTQVLKVIGNGTSGHMWKFGDMPKPEGVKAGQEQDILAYIRAMQAANGIGSAPAAAMPAMGDHQGHAGH